MKTERRVSVKNSQGLLVSAGKVITATNYGTDEGKNSDWYVEYEEDGTGRYHYIKERQDGYQVEIAPKDTEMEALQEQTETPHHGGD